MRNSPHTSLYLSIPLLLSATSVLANSPHIVYTTEVVTALTTVCPSSTELVHGDHTYTITESTTFTITDCPCTRTYPAISPGAPKTILYTTCSSAGSNGPQKTAGAGGDNSNSEAGKQSDNSGLSDAGKKTESENQKQNENSGEQNENAESGENSNSNSGEAGATESTTPESFRGAATRGLGLGMAGMVEVLVGVVGVVGWFL
ncbi:hypothetical protein ACMFMF_004821 [Clarireedia jacksonii]